jgi:hypothetical protein
MNNDKDDITIPAHKKFAVDLYNLAWDLIEKKTRTPEETEMMLQAAHGSAYHWSQLEGNVDEERWRHSFAISHHQISLAYHEAGNAERALYHAKRSLEYFAKYGVGGFPDAYGYECLAKAYNLAGDIKNRDESLRKGIEAGNRIKEDEFRKSFFDELSSVTGYDMIGK